MRTTIHHLLCHKNASDQQLLVVKNLSPQSFFLLAPSVSFGKSLPDLFFFGNTLSSHAEVLWCEQRPGAKSLDFFLEKLGKWIEEKPNLWAKWVGFSKVLEDEIPESLQAVIFFESILVHPKF